ncbi:MAG TPA: beta-propeller fold lactonase family protein, partial [Bryobacteraceae bacterium]|nr:beta-propeller fold lactonase family protein [Bryobacteraceae bacterium]
MQFLRFAALAVLASSCLFAATFGTVVPVIGGAGDLVLDESRDRLYLINTNQNRIEVYSVADRRPPALTGEIDTGRQPLAAALSRDGKYLYVAAYEASALNIVDLDALTVQESVRLPARPEGVAVGADERVLVSTIGTGANNAANVLLIFDPRPDAAQRLTAVPVTPPPPAIPQVGQTTPRPVLPSRSYLQASPDGSIIIGVNLPNAAQRVVFVYEAASGTVLASRTVASISNVLSVSPDNTRFMSGLTLFDARTLEVLAQQNAANAPYPV